MAPLADFSGLCISIYPKNIEEHNISGVPPLQASIATKNQSGPYSGTLPEGGIPHQWRSSSSRCSSWRGGSSSPLGLRVCTNSYVFGLSLSHVLDLARSWCAESFVTIVESYGVFLSLYCDDLCFPFEISFYRIEYFYGFVSTWYMSCKWILMVTMGYYFDSLNSRIPEVTLG